MNKESSLAERLVLAMNKIGMTQHQLASVSGVSQASISKICRGDSKRSGYVVELANSLGVNPQWLATGDGDMWVGGDIGTAAISALEKMVGIKSSVENIPVLVARERFEHESARGLSEIVETITLNRPLSVASSLPTLTGQAKIVINPGDGMEPTCNDGDLLMVDTTVNSVSGGGIYVFLLNSQITVSRLQRRADGSLSVIYDNPAYQADTVPADLASSVEIIGLVKLIMRVWKA